jgi:hypothetical protein
MKYRGWRNLMQKENFECLKSAPLLARPQLERGLCTRKLIS